MLDNSKIKVNLLYKTSKYHKIEQNNMPYVFKQLYFDLCTIYSTSRKTVYLL